MKRTVLWSPKGNIFMISRMRENRDQYLQGRSRFVIEKLRLSGKLAYDT